MTECLYGTMKRRWPVLKNMRHHIQIGQKAIKACCILENMCHDLCDEVPEQDEDDGFDLGPVPNFCRNRPPVNGTALTRGKAVRLELMDRMLP